MKVKIIKCLEDNFSYLIIDETTQIACVIDPSESGPIINFIENQNINLNYLYWIYSYFLKLKI